MNRRAGRKVIRDKNQVPDRSGEAQNVSEDKKRGLTNQHDLNKATEGSRQGKNSQSSGMTRNRR